MVYVWADMYKQFAGGAIKSFPISATKYDKQKSPFPYKLGFSQKSYLLKLMHMENDQTWKEKKCSCIIRPTQFANLGAYLNADV